MAFSEEQTTNDNHQNKEKMSPEKAADFLYEVVQSAKDSYNEIDKIQLAEDLKEGAAEARNRGGELLKWLGERVDKCSKWSDEFIDESVENFKAKE